MANDLDVSEQKPNLTFEEREMERSRPSVVRNLLRRYYKEFGANAIRNSKNSRVWFRQMGTKLGKIRHGVMFQHRDWFEENPEIGRMYLFIYDARHKETLPYWDKVPLVFFFNQFDKNGVQYLMGMNLHYLPPMLRMILFANLLSLRNEKRYRERTKMMLSWEVLKNLAQHKLVEPCVHMYRKDHIKSLFIEVPSRDWEIVISLGLERFEKASSKKVWAESIKKRGKNR
jgi:hypothetical protein